MPHYRFFCKFVYRFLSFLLNYFKKNYVGSKEGKVRKLTLKNTLNCRKIINEFSARIEDFLNEK